MLCRTHFHTSISLLRHLFIHAVRCKFQKKLFSWWLADGFLDSVISNKRQPDISPHCKIKQTQGQCIRSRSSFMLELACLLVLAFFFLNRELHIKNYANFVSFGIWFLKQQTCFVFRDKRGLKHLYTMDGSKITCPSLLVFIFHDTARVSLIFLTHRGIHSISKDGKDTSF